MVMTMSEFSRAGVEERVPSAGWRAVYTALHVPIPEESVWVEP